MEEAEAAREAYEMMRFYHATTAAAAKSILSSLGFKDGAGTYLTDRLWAGVWLSDVPLDINEGAKGDTLLEVLVNASRDLFADYEFIEEGKSYREWLIPAAVLNPLIGAVRIARE
jgi:hypothetical protein